MNPFRETIVASPWDSQRGDVPGIHHSVFEECLKGLEQVRRTHRSAGLLIHGEAGSGKTHLLSRLRAHLAPQAPTATDRKESLFVWVRLQTSPRMIWRTVRRTLVEDWFRPVDGGRSQFDRILYHRMAEIRVAEGDLEPWHEYMLQEDPQGLQQLIERIADHLDLDRNTTVAFSHLAFGRHRRNLRAWLAGDSLPESVLERLGLSQDEGTDEEREDEAQRILVMLCKLAGPDLPILLSFDQVEALQASPDDREGLFAFGKLISNLHDKTGNLLLVSCVQSSFHSVLKADRSRGADYDRAVSLGALSLEPLRPEHARQLIRSRLEAFSQELPDVSSKSDCWPLSKEEFSELFEQPRPVTPRRLLGICAERYEDWLRSDSVVPSPGQEPVPSAPKSLEEVIPEFLKNSWLETVEKKVAANRHEMTEEIIRHGVPLVMPLVSPKVKAVEDELLPDVSLLYETESGRVGISLCTQPNMTSLAARFKRLKSQFQSPRIQRLVIVRDVRVPISPGAKKAKAYYQELQQAGAHVVHPSQEVLAALDALRTLLSDAVSGDLSCQGETLSPKTVEAWLREHLPGDVRDFAEELIAGPELEDRQGQRDGMLVDAIQNLLADEPIMSLDAAANSLQMEVAELEQVAQSHPELFGILSGPSETLIRLVKT